MSGTSSGTMPVEIVQTVSRKHWTSEQKLQMFEESMEPGNSVSRVARKNGISPALLYKWRKLMQIGGTTAVEADAEVVSMAEVKPLQKRVKALERALGRKTLENEILKAAVELGRKKTDLARALVRDRRFRIGPVAKALSVSRSNLYERQGEVSAKRQAGIKQDEADLLSRITRIADQRPTYGYRRVWAVLRQQLKAAGLTAVNHKRVYRIMKQNDLLLTRSSARYEQRAHTGRIITGVSNERWCSDGFEPGCRNGEKVRVIFALDCCDREVISFEASTGGYTSEMAQNALLHSIEKRFAAQKATRKLEWLTDNGSCFTAKETLCLAREVGVTNCFTPVRSPESNGMAEAFVKTLKRDYASINVLAEASQVIKMLQEWIEDYNENAPHKGLGWLSPRQFRREKLNSGNFPGAARVGNAA